MPYTIAIFILLVYANSAASKPVPAYSGFMELQPSPPPSYFTPHVYEQPNKPRHIPNHIAVSKEVLYETGPHKKTEQNQQDFNKELVNILSQLTKSNRELKREVKKFPRIIAKSLTRFHKVGSSSNSPLLCLLKNQNGGSSDSSSSSSSSSSGEQHTHHHHHNDINYHIGGAQDANDGGQSIQYNSNVTGGTPSIEMLPPELRREIEGITTKIEEMKPHLPNMHRIAQIMSKEGPRSGRYPINGGRGIEYSGEHHSYNIA